MQKNGKHMKLEAEQNKGFYIILSVCVLAILVSGYVLFAAPLFEDEEQDSMEYTGTTWVPEEPVISVEGYDTDQTVIIPEEPTQTEQTTAEIEQSVETVMQTEQTEQTEQTVNETEEAASEPVWILPVSGTVTNGFSGEKLVYHETLGDWRVHVGTDYSCNAGERVYSVQSGEITDITNDELWGTSVTLTIDDGRKAVYRGLEEDVKIKKGSHVSAGDVIGTVAELIPAEAEQSSHLHFELYNADGVPTDAELAG